MPHEACRCSRYVGSTGSTYHTIPYFAPLDETGATVATITGPTVGRCRRCRVFVSVLLQDHFHLRACVGELIKSILFIDRQQHVGTSTNALPYHSLDRCRPTRQRHSRCSIIKAFLAEDI